MAQRVGAKPEELMGVMSLETMGTFRPSVANPDTHATGLIQFMPRTAQGLGTSIGELSRMTPAEQLPWVEKYLSQPAYRGRVGTLEGLYSAVLPGHIMGPDEVMFRPGIRGLQRQQVARHRRPERHLRAGGRAAGPHPHGPGRALTAAESRA